VTGKIKALTPQTQNRHDGQPIVESTKGGQEIQRQARWSKWYRNKTDDTIIQRWAEACSDRYNDCLNCPFLKECQDLMDRLIACMEVAPTKLPAMIAKDRRRRTSLMKLGEQ